MIFWTIIFFIVSLKGLFGNGFARSFMKNLKAIELKKINGGSEKEYNEEWVKTGCLPLILIISLLIAEIIYLIHAIGYDTYKYPTIAAILLISLGFIRKSKKKKNTKDMSDDEITIYKAELLKEDKRSIVNVAVSLLWTIYFTYMFYILVF